MLVTIPSQGRPCLGSVQVEAIGAKSPLIHLRGEQLPQGPELSLCGHTSWSPVQNKNTSVPC